MQEVVKEGTGAWLAGGVVAVPGLITTENSWVPPPAALVVAVRPGAVPVATGAPESASRELTLPEPVAAGVARVVLVAGLVQVIGSVEDFSLQEFTSQEPGWATATEGVGVAGRGGGPDGLGRGGDRRRCRRRCGRPRRSWCP